MAGGTAKIGEPILYCFTVLRKRMHPFRYLSSHPPCSYRICASVQVPRTSYGVIRIRDECVRRLT